MLNILLSVDEAELEQHSYSDETDEDEDTARLVATIRFPNGSRLHVRLSVDELDGFPQLRDYAFHYMDAENATIFRYDNSDFHPGLPHEPHHKHEGADERVVGCPQPSISLIRDEIEAYLKGLN